MVTLEFSVTKQLMILNTDIRRFLPISTSDTVNHFKCEFDFDNSWDGFEKRVYFKNTSYNVTKGMLLDLSDSCYIPWEVLAHTGVITCNVIGLKYSNETVIQRVTTRPITFLIQVEESVLEPYDQRPLSLTEYEQFRVHFNDIYSLTVSAMETTVATEEHVESMAEEIAGYDSVFHEYMSDSEAYALGTRGGDPVTMSDPTYQNNSKYYASQAQDYMESASAALDFATDVQEELSEAWSAIDNFINNSSGLTDLGLSIVDGKLNITFEE